MPSDRASLCRCVGFPWPVSLFDISTSARGVSATRALKYIAQLPKAPLSRQVYSVHKCTLGYQLDATVMGLQKFICLRKVRYSPAKRTKNYLESGLHVLEHELVSEAALRYFRAGVSFKVSSRNPEVHGRRRRLGRFLTISVAFGRKRDRRSRRKETRGNNR